LLSCRAGRVRPGLDDKVLADWNGLAIAAIAQAATVFARPDWLDLALKVYGFVRKVMTRHGRLGHCWRDGALIFPGLSSDHAAMAKAAIALHAATGEGGYLDDTERWADMLDTHYADQDGGGYFLTADDAQALIIRPKSPLDEATPNPNGVMAEVLVRLWSLTGKDIYRARADRVLSAFSGDMLSNVFGTASLLNALDTRLAPTEIVIVAPAGTDLSALRRVAAGASDRRTIVLLCQDTGSLPSDHPAHGRPAVDGRPTAYLCRASTCSLPITEASDLGDLLSTGA
jgi:uncharacterized protein YyaL (SSP411 family)